MKTILVLGAGRVAAPAVRVLLEHGHHVRVANDDLDAARAILGGNARATAERLDARDPDAVRRAVAGADLALSLLPAPLHPSVARACVAEGRPFLSTSYVSPEIAALDSDARARGVLLMNECGLDPGLDHLLAIDLVERAHTRGARVVAFRSVCGGIPSPESNDNPFGYKISWSPRGVALAGTRTARWRENDAVAERGPGEIFRDPSSMRVDGLGALEVYPNGDSLPYAAKYGIDGVRSIFRGTFRWPGWCPTWRAIAQLGWLDDTAPADALREEEAARTLGLSAGDAVLERLRWIGLFDDGEAAGAARANRSRLDHLVALMESRMAYRSGERDLVVLLDEVTIEDGEHGNGPPRTLSATLVARGDATGDSPHASGDSAMAKLVGIPAGLAAVRILDGTIGGAGVRIPVEPQVVRTLLADLARAGIEARFRDAPAPSSAA